MTSRAVAEIVAAELLEVLGASCERIVVAGSLRRGAAEVKDVELVALPRMGVDLLGQPRPDDCELTRAIEREVSSGRLRWRTETHPTPASLRTARRMWALVHVPREVRVDLFAVRPPAQWGCILAIRTGPAEYSQQLVTRCRDRGLRCEDGRLVDERGRTVPTSTEQSFIAACGMPWREPSARGAR
jgi:DNA polymerase/3'-5' exonuclease PolX